MSNQPPYQWGPGPQPPQWGPGGPHQPPAPVKKPWWKRPWGIALIAFLALAVLGSLVDGDEGEVEVATAATDEATEEAEPTPTPTPTPTPEPTSEPAPETETEPTEPSPDAGAVLACQHFLNVRSDILAGILSTDEIREKLQEVHSNARISDEPGLEAAATAMLAAATRDDGEAFLEPFGEMGRLCADVMRRDND